MLGNHPQLDRLFSLSFGLCGKRILGGYDAMTMNSTSIFRFTTFLSPLRSFTEVSHLQTIGVSFSFAMHILFAASLFFSTALSLPRQPGKDTTWIPGPTAGTDLLAKEGLLQLTTYLQTKSSTQGSNNSCTLENAHRRKEWDTLIPDEKREYIKAVRCLQTLPSVSGDLVPGARTRYDDFV